MLYRGTAMLGAGTFPCDYRLLSSLLSSVL
jgi:hypothetical protein